MLPVVKNDSRKFAVEWIGVNSAQRVPEGHLLSSRHATRDAVRSRQERAPVSHRTTNTTHLREVHLSTTEASIYSHENPNHKPCQLAPPEAFSNRLAPNNLAIELRPWLNPHRVGPNSQTVTGVFASRCCGYPTPPSSRELYDGIRRAKPTSRDLDVLSAWIIESTEQQQWDAWTEQAYSWRMLARAMHLVQYPCWERYRNLNVFTIRPELIPPNSVPIW